MSKRPVHLYVMFTGRVLCHVFGEPLWTTDQRRVTCRRCRKTMRHR